MPMKVDIDPLDLVEPERFALKGYPHEVWSRLRAEAPVAFIEPPGYPPFWAVTKHADVQYAASQPQLFSSRQGITLDMDLTGIDMPAEMIVYLDPPEHGPMRKVANKKFLRSAVSARRQEIERIAAELVDRASTGGEIRECDFVDTFAAPFPVAVISWVLGVPEADWEHHFRWTNEIIGKDDPEYRLPGESPEQTSRRARGELHRYFKAMVAARRQDPQDDLVTQLVQSEVNGVPLTSSQLVNYCELLVEAGNQTTRDAIAGGMQAFCEFPDQWEKLRAHPELLPDAVEEILRWVTPISYFSRTATQDCELHGQQIHAGDKVALYWASANRDEEVFDDPFEFRIDRPPSQPVVFGFGPHLCMGAHVARAELMAMFGLLVSRMEWFEQSGPVERLNFVGERRHQAPAHPVPPHVGGGVARPAQAGRDTTRKEATRWTRRASTRVTIIWTCARFHPSCGSIDCLGICSNEALGWSGAKVIRCGSATTGSWAGAGCPRGTSCRSSAPSAGRASRTTAFGSATPSCDWRTWISMACGPRSSTVPSR